jgi:nitrite reductase (NO-forming) / hydroxylamine reductase
MKSIKFIKAGLFFLLFALILAACGGTTPVSTREYLLTTGMEDGKFVFLGVGDSINGQANPTLVANPGETITITLINGGHARQQLAIKDVRAKTAVVSSKGEIASVTFTLPNHLNEVEYYDPLDNNAELGMKGKIAIGAAYEPVQPISSDGLSAPTSPGLYDYELAIASFQKGGCSACHVIPGIAGAGTIGPDLSDIGAVAKARLEGGEYDGAASTVEAYLVESIQDPDAFLSPNCPAGPCGAGMMPASLAAMYSQNELDAMVRFMASLPGGADAAITGAGAGESVSAAPSGSAAGLSEEEFAWASQTYFERCAGCHGTLRKGATGPGLTPDLTQPKGTIGLAAIIFNGTTRGMPDWGKQGFMTQAETEVMAKFLQNEPPAPPELPLAQMLDSWELLVPVSERPNSPQTTRNWQNYFVVTLRDAGQVAIIDGDTYEIVNTVDSGYAVHITRMSATGRYAYVTGRDGRLALIDLWMEKPEVVARVQTCYDARSVEVSKYQGPEGDFNDKYAISGCYWPPHFTIHDGETLEPFKVISTRGYTYDTEEFHPEPRVAAIIASHFKPEWIVNVKETGQIWIVNYVDPHNPTIKMVEAARFLHDGGWDSSKRYFMVAANQSNKIAVMDALEGSLIALVDTPAIPHPGRGANWLDPDFGPVWSTAHLGDPVVVSIATDPVDNPQHAWKAVRSTPLPGSGSLFIKTHPNSRWIWVDMTLNPDPVLARTVCVIDRENPAEVHKCWEIGDYGRAVHFEYNKDGTEVWVSLWGDAAQPGQTGAIVIYDDATLEEKARIDNLITPTGKFNVYNTVNDIY